jgi:hypothetical protein
MMPAIVLAFASLFYLHGREVLAASPQVSMPAGAPMQLDLLKNAVELPNSLASAQK